MTKKLTYILTAALTLMLGFSACTDDIDEFGGSADAPGMRLYLQLPGTDTQASRASGTDTGFGNPDNTTDYQRYIYDVYVLVFKNEDHTLLGEATNVVLAGTNGDANRSLNCNFYGFTGAVDVVFVANLSKNMNSVPDFSSMIGNTEKAVYENLVYNFPENGQILTSDRYLPMWGKAENVNLGKYVVTATVPVYRAVAKMSVAVDDACTNFSLKEVYVYYGNNKGYAAAPNVTPDPSASVQYSTPDVPASAAQFDLVKAQKYTIADGAQSIADIYLAEANNKDAEQPVKVVVGGVWTGEGLVDNNGTNLSYYRIDLVDLYDEENKQTTTGTPFDIIRNHSYEFNITGVNNPGTPSPEAALTSDVAKLQVVITAYTEDYMRGVSDQYTLTTDQSVINFESSNDNNPQEIDPQILTIWTDYDLGWSIQPIAEGEDIPDWIKLDVTEGDKDQTVEITISPSVNYGLSRTGRFYVVAGTIKKEITIVQAQPNTANSYVANGLGDGSGDEGVYRLIVGIKGNGNEGIMPDNGSVSILESGSSATINPAKIGVIWETHAGLVTLIDVDENGNDVYHTKNVAITSTTDTDAHPDNIDFATNFDRTMMAVRYKVDLSVTKKDMIGGVEGGNALIGAFDDDNNILWTWHIWATTDLIDGNTGKINSDYIEKWSNGYEVMDRNLGALANRPKTYTENGTTVTNSVASMGLLYQWGRKEPFIGPKYSNDNFDDDGLVKVCHYYKNWSTENISSQAQPITYCQKNPTTMVFGKDGTTPTGLVTLADKTTSLGTGGGALLWGTNQGFQDTEVGTKTIYDPCPPGYRVPPVNAYVFDDFRYSLGNWSNTLNATSTTYNKEYQDVYVEWRTSSSNWNYKSTVIVFYSSVNPYTDHPTGYNYFRFAKRNPLTTQRSSLDQNWNENLTFIPFNPTERRTSVLNTNTFYSYIYEGKFLNNADYYGFYLDYKKNAEPLMSYNSRNSNGYDYYKLKDDDQSKIAWFPISGAYDPTKGLNFKNSKIDNYSTISVNSFLWTNSSIKNADGNTLPAAMFLHGTENQGTTTHGSGRHIHGMSQTNVKADPHFAGAVRCVKNVMKYEWKQNTVSPTAVISRAIGSTTTISIVSIAAGWQLVDPGAPWIKVTPDRGTKTGAAGKTITLEIVSDPGAGATTTLKFQIEGETEARTVTVTTTN